MSVFDPEKFNFAYAFTKKWEGGYSNHPADPGGVTNYGITLDSLKDYARIDPNALRELGLPTKVTASTVKSMNAKQAEGIFKRFYWSNHSLDDYPKRNAAFLFDCCVNHGWRNAVLIGQRAYNDVCEASQRLATDGICGSLTRAAFRLDSEPFIVACVNRREEFYRAIVQKRPSQHVFLVGWMNRIADQRKYLGA